MKSNKTQYLTEGTAALDATVSTNPLQEHIISFPSQEIIEDRTDKPTSARSKNRMRGQIMRSDTYLDLKYGHIKGLAPAMFTKKQAIVAGAIMTLITFSTLLFI